MARIGSSVVTDAATMPAASQQRCHPAARPVVPKTPRPVSTSQTDTPSSTRVIAVSTTLATGNGTRASGLNTIAARGG